jgi:hypothetical protein
VLGTAEVWEGAEDRRLFLVFAGHHVAVAVFLDRPHSTLAQLIVVLAGATGVVPIHVYHRMVKRYPTANPIEMVASTATTTIIFRACIE